MSIKKRSLGPTDIMVMNESWKLLPGLRYEDRLGRLFQMAPLAEQNFLHFGMIVGQELKPFKDEYDCYFYGIEIGDLCRTWGIKNGNHLSYDPGNNPKEEDSKYDIIRDAILDELELL